MVVVDEEHQAEDQREHRQDGNQAVGDHVLEGQFQVFINDF